MINHKKGGFTLIELLVVIAIIGILSSVVLASLNTARQKARDARRISDMGQVQLALELYFDSCSQYPVSGALATLPAATESTGCAGSNQWDVFMPINPTDPVTSNQAYGYALLTTTTYCVGANLEDSGHPNIVDQCDVESPSVHNHELQQ